MSDSMPPNQKDPPPPGGLFAEYFRPAEMRLLNSLRTDTPSLSGEIDLLRIGLRRMALAFQRLDAPSLKDYRAYLTTASMTCLRMERLIQTEVALHAVDDDLKAALKNSLRALLASWELEGRQVEE